MQLAPVSMLIPKITRALLASFLIWAGWRAIVLFQVKGFHADHPTWVTHAYESCHQHYWHPGRQYNDISSATYKDMHLGTPLNSKSDPDNDLFHAQQAIHLLLPIVDPDLRHWHTRVSMYVQSAAFKEHLQQVANSPYKQGILINAGGRKLMTHAIIFRHTLTVQLRCLEST
eukprot:jgi/Chrzof1/6090/Cz17g09100.t1